MALAKRQSANSRIIVIALIVLGVGIALYFAYTKWLSPSATETNTNTATPRISGYNFDRDILDDPRLKNLQYYPAKINPVTNPGQEFPFQ